MIFLDVSSHLLGVHFKRKQLKTKMVVKGQFLEPAVCFSDLWACEELIPSFIRQKPYDIMLRQQFSFLFNIYQPKFQFMIFTLANNHFIVCLQVDLDLQLT